MLSTLKSAVKAEDTRKKILFTLMMFLVFRIGTHIPVPNINGEVIHQLTEQAKLLGFFDMISGGAFKNFSIFAMSITPYINASIIMQLLTVIIPKLEQLAKEDRKKIAEYTRYLTVVLAFVQAIGVSFGFKGALVNTSIGSIALVALTLTAGTACLMWIGELITEKGIGNGISLIIFAGIVSRIPNGCLTLYSYIVEKGAIGVLVVLLFAVIALAAIVAVVAIQEGQRRIPVQYAKRVVGRKVYGGQSTHIPIKVNSAGVIPVIFAMSILMFPGTIASFFPNSGFAQTITNIFDASGIFYNILYALLIVFFTYFYSAISFNPVDVAENIKKNGGFIPGLRPGRPTSDYISKVMSRITLFGAIFLAAIAVLPAIIMGLTGLELYFGGTALLIVVGVALDTMKQLEASLLMRSYEGFMK
ncbi:MAG: preprotein translocase subunit SecY [Peptococcaceae bacterium]|nr:preprotein translocase subunit SecY [Peptococcaceae bacterium]MBO5114573.1 preprotein translocase subunit SecY [Peptococcaceae bacterium]MBP3341759.1 preprotein translocase subunit SecY [Peptococcaceae bacterium]MBP3624443.1 preprotein translocase subunit SecY [Peptococcaceae bacterium]